MIRIPGKLGEFHRHLQRFAAHEGVSEHEALRRLGQIFDLSANATGVSAPQAQALDEGEIIVTCEMCCDPSWEQWWRDNFGVFWQAAKWWYCGSLGQECECGGNG